MVWAASPVMNALEVDVILAASADVPPPSPWDNTVAFVSSLVRICQSPSGSVLFIELFLFTPSRRPLRRGTVLATYAMREEV